MGKRFNPVLNKRYKAVDIVKVALGQNSVETGTSNPVDLFHQAYFICYNSGSCDTGATKSMEIVRPLTGRFVRQTVVMRASGHYWDGDMGGLLIRYAEKAAEKGQTWRAVPVIVREYPLIEFHDFWPCDNWLYGYHIEERRRPRVPVWEIYSCCERCVGYRTSYRSLYRNWI